jgi:Invasin, domain 3
MIMRLRIAFVLPLLIGVIVGLPAQSAVAFPPAATTFSSMDAEQSYTVPSGVTMVEVEAAGGNGGVPASDGTQHSGPGVDLEVALPFTPGQLLYPEVGAPGTSGFGGGGGAGGGAAGGTGGGASDVRTRSMLAVSCAGGGSSSASRLVVASGGGGLGGSPPSSEVDVGSTCGGNDSGGPGWDGSAPIAVAGGTVLPGEGDVIGGTGNQPAGGGTASGPGVGGMIADCTGGGRTYFGAVSGAGGSAANGGAGGTGGAGAGGGGGGGGGYFGGGGGPSGQQRTITPCGTGGGTCVSSGSGGAGGASFYASQATGRIFYGNDYTLGANPFVTVTPLIEIDSPTGGAQYNQGQVVEASYSCLECAVGPGQGGTVPSGSPIDTSTLGTHSFQVTDISQSGATPAVSTVHYSVQGPATAMSVALSPSSIVANGTSTTTATATVTDAQPHPIAGDHVTFASTDAGDVIGSVTDHGDGTYTATVTSSTTAQTATITATDSSVSPGVTGHATLTQTPPPAGGGGGSQGAGTPPPANTSPPEAKPATATVGRATVSRGTVISVPVACAGSAGTSCTVTLTLTLVETVKGRTLVAVSAAKRRTKTTRRIVTVASRTITLAAGRSQDVHVALNSTGRQLLGRLHKLPVILTGTQHANSLSSQMLALKAPAQKPRKR